MTRAFAGRLLATIPVALGIVLITFLAIRLVPGDAVNVILNEFYDEESARQMRALFGLDLPLHEQFASWFSGLVRGDLGSSFRTGRSVTGEIVSRLPATLLLTVGAVAFSLVIAIPAGIVAATRRGRASDFVARLASLVGLSTPNFFLGILLILLFSVTWGVLPAGGYVPISEDAGQFGRHLVLPVVTLGTSMAAVTMRMTRSSMLEVLNENYVRTARAKGLAPLRITMSHGFRNAFIPVITVVGIQVGSLLGGAVVVEKIFSWPGLGTLVVDSILARDYPLIQGAVLFLAIFFVLANLAVDLLYIILDPRIRNA